MRPIEKGQLPKGFLFACGMPPKGRRRGRERPPPPHPEGGVIPCATVKSPALDCGFRMLSRTPKRVPSP